MTKIIDFEIHKLVLPLGRMIGDNNCNYNEMDLLCVVLKTNHGHVGWGYAESVWNGTFHRRAWYINKLPSIKILKDHFNKTWWPKLKNQRLLDLEDIRIQFQSSYPEIDRAVRLALWDLLALEQNLPLYKVLNPLSTKTDVLAYGSILDFPLNDEEAVTLTNQFKSEGFKIIKVKIGAEKIQRDIDRLNLIKETVGGGVHLTADVNEAWTWQRAIECIDAFEKNDIHLDYIEDPLPYDDIQGYKELAARSSVRIIGHDYIDNFEQMKLLVEEGGIKGIRTGKDIDYSLQCIALAKKHNLPIYLGNSIFEINIHLGLAFDQVNRLEYSFLKWNDLIKEPIIFINGKGQAPLNIGHGLYPKNDLIEKFIEVDSFKLVNNE